MKQELNQIMKGIRDSQASVQSGKTVLCTDFASVVEGGTNDFKLISFVISSIKTFPKKIEAVLKGKNKKALFCFAGLAVIWLVVDILLASGVDNGLIRILSLLTFAEGGGLNRGFLGVLGGIAGRSLYATALFSLINGNGKEMLKGIKNLISQGQNLFKDTDRSFTLMGMGTALVLFEGLAGHAGLNDVMGAVALLLLGGQSLTTGKGLLMQLATKFAGARSTVLLEGLTAGFGLAVIFTVIPLIGGFSIYAGILLILASILLHFTSGKGGGRK